MSTIYNICVFALLPFSILMNALLYWRVRIEVWYGDSMRKLQIDTMDEMNRCNKEWKRICTDILSNNKDNIDYDA